MKVSFDIETYKANFLGGSARSYLFFVNLKFPGFSNVAQAGLQSGLAGGLPSSLDDLKSMGLAGLGSAASTGIGAMGMDKDTSKFPYYVRSTSLPVGSIEEIVAHWMGQPYKIAGMQTYEDWTVTFSVDNKGDNLRKFNQWQKLIRDSQTNYHGMPVTYMADQEVHLLGLDGETVVLYKLYGAWPKQIGQIALDYSSQESAQFDVVFSYQYHAVFESEPSAVKEITKRAFFSGLGG